MRVLFVHQNFPGQYLHLARFLGADPRNDVVFITQRREGALPGVRKIIYKPSRPVTATVHHYVRETEAAVINAQQVARAALSLRASGFVPDVMVGHNGWGEIWYLKDVFPKTPLLGYFEFFYRLTGADVGFDPAEPITPDTAPRIRTKNIGNLLALDTVDLGQTPTFWQRSVYPARYHPLLQVIHEGVDTNHVRPDADATFELPGSSICLSRADEIVTYVARNLEPYRGFPTFMRALPEILSARPQTQVLIIGGDAVSYGARPPPGTTFRQILLDELGDRLDLTRVHFLGRISHASFLKVLQLSSVHVYLTYPFVLSWSMLEAMAAGCLVVGSKTQPVEEVIQHQRNGFLVDFFSPQALAKQVVDVLKDPSSFNDMRRAARETVVQKYDLGRICLPAQVGLLDTVARWSR